MKVRRALIDRWVDDHRPNGISKLAIRSDVSASTIEKIRLGYIPKRDGIRRRLCEALGVPESEVFEFAPTDSATA